MIKIWLSMNMSAKSLALNFLLSTGLFCVCFYLAWQASAATNFLYSVWYEVLEIDETISTYAPRNKNRKEFEHTSKQEQVRLFSGIVTGIQNKGKGLGELKYANSNGKVIDTLLTDAEVIHLNDVANLVSNFKHFAIIGGLISLIAFTLMFILKTKLAKFKSHLIGTVGLIAIILILILIVGPTKVFYAGHELIFPNNHQWFFYYEDSLMSTMMKAPVLFGPIACELLILAFILWIGFLYGLQIVNTKLE